MEQFVCVRLVQANALDLSLFQFDFDLTFAVFFLNADKTVYGRFGSHSETEDATGEISMEGFRDALLAALRLHREYPANRSAVAGKSPEAIEFKRPEDYPSLKGRYTDRLDYEGNVVQSCIHCHQVRDAQRKLIRDNRQPIPDRVLFPWPLPDVVGLSLDVDRSATVQEVAAASPAQVAGFQAGDEIVSLAGQPLVSIADVQWVLHNAADEGTLPAIVRRDGESINLSLALPSGWRSAQNLSRRASTWDLRRMATGGLLLEELTDDGRRQRGLADEMLALRAKHVGQYGEHAIAKRAGVRKDDIIVGFAGTNRRMSESQLLAYVLQHHMPGETVSFEILRGDRRIAMEMKLP